MSFNVPAEKYDAFIGRFSRPLSAHFADFAGILAGQRVLDVGSGPGALTAELVARLGSARVVAVDPSEPFVAAVRERYRGVTALQASAEDLPFETETFDAALAQLVVHFMSDPVAGLTEMARVTRRGGVVASCVWDHAGGTGPLGLFWDVAHEVDPAVDDESGLAGVREGHLAELLAAAGMRDVRSTTLSVRVEYATFEEWWAPFEGGVGPAGAYVAGLDADRREAFREACRQRLRVEPVVVAARAWASRGTVGPI